MKKQLIQIYHQLPPPLRSVAASARGHYLYSWRYGPETESLVAEAHEREHWSAAEWETYRTERLGYALHRAVTQVPYYRDQWMERRRRGDQASWDYLENWPILEKNTLREQPLAFVADDRDTRQMLHEHTSGTTGKPLDLWWSRPTVRGWYALFEARWRRWYGVSLPDRWAILGGQLVTPVEQRQPPFWVWNDAFHQLYMSSYHLAPDLIPTYFEALVRYQIKYMLGYTSSLYALAQEALRLGRHDIQMTVVITNAEPVYTYQREAIAQAFGCPVRETYGMSEIVAAAGECEAGRLHIWPEAGWIEVHDNNGQVPVGNVGDLICTSLLNTDMPLIRYRVGDRGALAPDSPCDCGRTLPALASVEGRTDDVLYTPDGRLVGRLDPVFKSSLPIREAQIVQEATDRIRVRYVPAVGFSPEDEETIVAQIQARMGKMQVIMEEVGEVPRTSNGKFRAVICQLSPAEREILLAKRRQQ